MNIPRERTKMSKAQRKVNSIKKAKTKKVIVLLNMLKSENDSRYFQQAGISCLIERFALQRKTYVE